MKLSDYGIFGMVAFLAMFVAQVFATYVTSSKPNNLGKFDLHPARVANDLDGRLVQLGNGQVWPLDMSQNIQVILGKKKALDEYVVVIAEVYATAPVQQEDAPATPKEQFSTSPTAKTAPKTTPPAKLPTKLNLKGSMKLTYELVGDSWYLIGAENLNLKAIPVD